MPWDEGLVNSLIYDEPDPKLGRVAMEKDPSVFVHGQGVDDPGGMFGTSKGLKEKFGSDRVFDTPLSEEGMMGISNGAAMNGLRPVYMHNRPDFLLLAFNQIVTHAAKFSYIDNGQTKVPLVVWAAIGRGWGSGAQHSQAVQGLLMQVPGVKIVMPSNPFDAKGLLLASIEDNNPVFVFEHRWLMKQKGIVPEALYKVPLGKGIYRKRGSHLTIVGTSHTLEQATKAAEKCEASGITADIIDLRTIKPYDEAIILESVKKTGKLLVVDTGWMMGGVCAEIGCMVAEKGFHDLKAPVRRVGMPDIPTAAGFTLEQMIYPNPEKIEKVIRELCQQ
jgi:pyruvate/2-oxoglutarate/acetoin dehydrogenase E1 component